MRKLFSLWKKWSRMWSWIQSWNVNADSYILYCKRFPKNSEHFDLDLRNRCEWRGISKGIRLRKCKKIFGFSRVDLANFCLEFAVREFFWRLSLHLRNWTRDFHWEWFDKMQRCFHFLSYRNNYFGFFYCLIYQSDEDINLSDGGYAWRLKYT